jgi:NMD protein affecting ribosome stability and mRNA decay
MKTSGKYSKSTTKKSIDTEKDPYLLKVGPGDRAVCTKCGAVYRNKRWMLGREAEEKTVKTVKVLCPACQKIKDGYAGGFVTLRGDFLRDHSEEIINMVRNKEKRAMYYNPLDRIISIKKRKGGNVEITTTTDKLAQRIGQMLGKAYNGSVEYKWSTDINTMTRVVWTRQV